MALTLLQRLTKPMVLTDMMIRSRRRPLTRTPADVGLDYEDVTFSATDGVELRGWFIPRAGAEEDRARSSSSCTELGPMGPTMVKPTNLLYRAWRRPLPSKHDPAVPARKLGDTVVRYVQGTGDQWGTMEIIEEFARVTPNTESVVRFESAGRYEGYRYVNEAVDDVVDFFRANL